MRRTLSCVVGFGLLLQIAVSVFASYALARKRFRGSALTMLAILTTMMLPEEVIAIPLSVVLSDLPGLHINLIGTYAGMILPLGAWGFSIIVMTEFMGTCRSTSKRPRASTGRGSCGCSGRWCCRCAVRPWASSVSSGSP